MSADTVKAARLLYIRDRLTAGACSAEELARETGAHHRTINRDMLDLESAPLYTPVVECGGRYRINAMREFLTPADLLARGLGLGPLPAPPEKTPVGAVSCISGKPLTLGYRAADFVTGSMTAPLDTFGGSLAGWISDAEARMFRNAAPSQGALTTRQVMVFEDAYYRPLVSRESAAKEGHSGGCWSICAPWAKRRIAAWGRLTTGGSSRGRSTWWTMAR